MATPTFDNNADVHGLVISSTSSLDFALDYIKILIREDNNNYSKDKILDTLSFIEDAYTKYLKIKGELQNKI